MSQPSEGVQSSPKNRKRRLLAIFGFIALVALILGLVAYSSLNPSLNLVQTKTFNTCQQVSTIFNNTSTTTTTINNCQQITGLPLTVVSSASLAVTKTIAVTNAPSTHEYHPKLNGQYNPGTPTLSISDPPTLASPTLVSGEITIFYGDGTPTVLSMDQVTLTLCATTCVSLPATLRQTSTGTYAYMFIPPSLTGTVTIYLPAESLADDNGRIFPSYDTQIGTYAFTPTTATATTTATTTGTTTAAASTTVNQIAPQVVNTEKPTQPFPIEELLAVLIVLALAGFLLTLPLKPRRSKKGKDSAP